MIPCPEAERTERMRKALKRTALIIGSCGVLGLGLTVPAVAATASVAAPAVHCHATGRGLYRLPDRHFNCTPGITYAAVTQANIGRTICRRGWTATIRPPESYTEPIKLRQMAEYGYYGGRNPHNYEEDHLIPLELGGAPRAVRNLWPEYDAGHIPNPKDAVENALKRAVCAHRVTLRRAQIAIAQNWTTAERVLGIRISTQRDPSLRSCRRV